LPAITRLATQASDRPSQVAASELLHALVLYLVRVEGGL
jgi:hypothetical protein